MQRNSLIGDTIRSLGFLSRLPLPQSWFENGDDSLPRNARAFPLAGAVLGLLAGAVLFAGHKLNLPPLACALLAIGALAAMTGALHEDGLGDTADGFFGASSRDRRLDIMKDSRIGTFAALTLIVFVGVKAALLMAIIDRAGAGYAALALIGCEGASRAAMLAFWHALPSVRPGGLSDSMGQPQWETVVCGFGIGLVLLVFTLIPAGGFLSLINALVLATVLLLGFARLCMAKIGGQTGDTLGAAQQIASLAVLAGLVMAL
ncbi:adenosylcobinamide-GDP ribazoletransferase [Ochrobactrum vermis]|uniref:Adenosylcobinamide-GDP ribazoletransferase n=1 Tax=Ochrobactrum vermis TaxID=1827297 RepID=A0ABU8PA90_9HYPH|nr:adenosylcobinamide-GDP ribazoletransferase [Ochrobactrum vermis]PQZ31229.1 adenosylcobinamide-GDP ribazoletransferase [Ochrobactrum vermis]